MDGVRADSVIATTFGRPPTPGDPECRSGRVGITLWDGLAEPLLLIVFKNASLC
jgi:hypothetical protein